MKLLAIEASTQEASCALFVDGRIVERRLDPSVPSSETIIPAIRALLAEAGAGVAGLDCIAFGAGPGSFTGLRVAIGITQGLAFPFDLPVVGVETLAALAHAALVAAPGKSHALATLDARMREIYAATYRRDAEGVLRCGAIVLAPPATLDLPAGLSGPEAAGWLLCGNAAAAYPAFAARVASLFASEVCLPRAADIAMLGAIAFARGEAVGADVAAPLYVRDKVAQTVAERLAAGGRA